VEGKKLYRHLLWIQGIYILLTAVWPLIDMESFLKISGPKTDIWLVKTVAVLLIPIAILFISTIFFSSHPLPVLLVGIATSAGLASIELYYTANHTIKWVYAVDGILQICFFLLWGYLLFLFKKQRF
jgi:hypothetical protein